MKQVLTTFFIVILFSCSVQKSIVKNTQPEIEKVPEPQKESVVDYSAVTTQFFKTCENDIDASSKIISEKELIKSLSHLNRMGSGGAHYYLLEKKAITKMLNELASYTYSDCYLIDQKGKIVYSMYNDEVLGKKVTSYKLSPLMPMYFDGVKNISHIIDVTKFPVMSESYDVYFSRPVKKNGEMHGVLVTAVDIGNLTKQLPAASRILSRSTGTFKYHSDKRMFNEKDDIYYNLVSNDMFTTTKAVQYRDGLYYYQPVEYKSISWLLLIRQQYTTALNERQ